MSTVLSALAIGTDHTDVKFLIEHIDKLMLQYLGLLDRWR